MYRKQMSSAATDMDAWRAQIDAGRARMQKYFKRDLRLAANERRGDNLKKFKGSELKANTRIWP